MHRFSQKNSHKNLVEFFGWYGVGAILTGYILASFGVIETTGLAFPLLNLTGATGLIVISIVKKERQTTVLNFFWAAIALMTIAKLLLEI